jgi:hypothetical protein
VCCFGNCMYIDLRTCPFAHGISGIFSMCGCESCPAQINFLSAPSHNCTAHTPRTSVEHAGKSLGCWQIVVLHLYVYARRRSSCCHTRISLYRAPFAKMYRIQKLEQCRDRISVASMLCCTWGTCFDLRHLRTVIAYVIRSFQGVS